MLDGGDNAPVGGAGVALFASARVDGDGFDADALRHFRDVDRNNGIFVPAGAKLDSQRNFDGGADGLENIFEQREIAQQTGTAALDDFFRRTTEIDVHRVVAQVFDHFCGFRHDGGISAEKLRRDGMLVFLEIEIAQSFFRAARDSVGAGELRHEQAAAAEAANDAAKECVRHPGHGGKNRGGEDGQIANLEARRNHTFSLGW